jgi:hypothetical protein
MAAAAEACALTASTLAMSSASAMAPIFASPIVDGPQISLRMKKALAPKPNL